MHVNGQTPILKVSAWSLSVCICVCVVVLVEAGSSGMWCWRSRWSCRRSCCISLLEVIAFLLEEHLTWASGSPGWTFRLTGRIPDGSDHWLTVSHRVIYTSCTHGFTHFNSAPLNSEISFLHRFQEKKYCVKKKEHCSEFKRLNFKCLTIVAVSSQVAYFPHVLQPDLSASLSEQEGTQSETDHRHFQLGRLRPGVTHTLPPAHLPKSPVSGPGPLQGNKSTVDSDTWHRLFSFHQRWKEELWPGTTTGRNHRPDQERLRFSFGSEKKVPAVLAGTFLHHEHMLTFPFVVVMKRSNDCLLPVSVAADMKRLADGAGETHTHN